MDNSCRRCGDDGDSVVVEMVAVVVEGIRCLWVTVATAAVKTYQQELISETLM